jgi:hypothetical protein
MRRRKAAYIRVRQTAVVVHDFGTQKVSKRRQAEFKNILMPALKLVGMVQTLLELNLFFGPECPLQRQKHVRILRRKSATRQKHTSERGCKSVVCGSQN